MTPVRVHNITEAGRQLSFSSMYVCVFSFICLWAELLPGTLLGVSSGHHVQGHIKWSRVKEEKQDGTITEWAMGWGTAAPSVHIWQKRARRR